MKTKKTGFIAVLAVTLFITAMLVTTCIDPMADKDLSASIRSSSDPVYVPPGKALLTLNIGDSSNARTIFPNQPAAGGWFYTIALTGGVTNPNPTGPYQGAGSFSIAVEDGETYTVVVTSFTSADERTAGRAAMVSDPSETYSITIDASAPASNQITVDMVEVITGTNTGIFSYSIPIPAGVTAELDIEGIGGAALSGDSDDTIALTAGETNASTTPHLSLVPGYYRMTVSMTQPPNRLGVSISEVVYIFPTMTSHYAPTNIPLSLINTLYTVTYFNHNGTALDAALTAYDDQTISHGATIANAPATIPDGGLLTPAGEIHVGWSRTQGGTAYDFGGSDRVIRNINLYAIFEAADTLRVIISHPTYADNFGTITAVSTPTPLTVAALEDPATTTNITITVPNSALFTAGSLTWKHASSAFAGSFTAGVATIDLTEVNDELYTIFAPGTHTIIIEGILAATGRLHSTYVTYTIPN